MNETTCMTALDEIYAAFGKASPTPRIRQAVYRKIVDLPNDFMVYAQRRLEDMETLPQNLGRYMLVDLWPDYLAENPQLKAQTRACPDCDTKTPGWFTVWKPGGERLICECVCRKGNDTGWTRKRALAAGYLLEDPLRANAGAFPTGLCRKAIGHSEAPRPAHLEELEEVGF